LKGGLGAAKAVALRKLDPFHGAVTGGVAITAPGNALDQIGPCFCSVSAAAAPDEPATNAAKPHIATKRLIFMITPLDMVGEYLSSLK